MGPSFAMSQSRWTKEFGATFNHPLRPEFTGSNAGRKIDADNRGFGLQGKIAYSIVNAFRIESGIDVYHLGFSFDAHALRFDTSITIIFTRHKLNLTQCEIPISTRISGRVSNDTRVYIAGGAHYRFIPFANTTIMNETGQAHAGVFSKHWSTRLAVGISKKRLTKLGWYGEIVYKQNAGTYASSGHKIKPGWSTDILIRASPVLTGGVGLTF